MFMLVLAMSMVWSTHLKERVKEMQLHALSKTASMHFLQMISKSENFPSSMVRIFLTYGPNQKLKDLYSNN